ncbi:MULTISPECIES: efflux RND transporter periplasmic adaptor subunit [Hyphomicrobium]|jgi:RND family efflux transporter MFP subunit|uniref:efflux RND transporter periplasmic adaptor subunit n=1 Tax=Hyphomicrobium TaxID=81 RepID=UPI0003734944|nr:MULTISPECIES: efflux RND transporter periplasmic adaptor subunit [Hyphomicrobium]WBT39729.1 efflux RND transporter periplasmic adaptor subunit [Hyphomicrobium sp. DMF-1]HML43707.1 efflux RND transporter periplasmic adaptor subunit [Hyphomicrobium zavarzinii]
MLPRRFRPAAAATVLFSLLLAGCGESQPNAQAVAPPAPKVTVAKPVKKLVSDFDEYVGRFVAYDFVEVRSRVSGYLDKIHFTDGQMIKEGDDLFTIDRRPFEAALAQAKAAREQAEANLAFAESDLKRGESLIRGTTITQQTLDQRTQAKRVAEASVTAQEAAQRQAELDLQFTELKAPISGRIGDRRVSVGNLVTGGTAGNTTLLATVVSVDPIRFEFTMDEASYLRYLRAATEAAATSSNRGMSLPVKLKLIDERDFVHEGKIDFVDNAIDRSSGTIRGRAEFRNPDGKLTPGMFGRIQIAVSKPAVALLVPDSAIGTEQVRKFVYAVSPDDVANPKYVTLGSVVDGMRVITDGLDSDDTVVVNGLMRVRPGTKVSPQQATASNGDGKGTVVGTN